MKESSFYQMILAEGEAKGVAEGVAKGKVEEARRILLRPGPRRFGPPDPGRSRRSSRRTPVERIEGLIERLLEVSSWEELLARPRTGSDRGRLDPGTIPRPGSQAIWQARAGRRRPGRLAAAGLGGVGLGRRGRRRRAS